MGEFRFNTTFLFLSFLLPFAGAQAGGKHLEVMVPLCKQSDFVGKPHKVTERCFEASDTGGGPTLTSTQNSEYDKDGNALLIESFDASNRRTDFEKYGYDAGGTWISLEEQTEGALPVTSRIFVDVATRRIAKVDQSSKNTEFTSYSEGGFELASVTQTAAGRMLEKVTFKRNPDGKEEHVVFEEPPGKKDTEISVKWTVQGFVATMTLTMHDEEGGSVITSFEYPDVDAAGNWLTQVRKKTLFQKDGREVPLPMETVKRTITYHP